MSRRGAERWQHGHPWIYASDVAEGPEQPGLVAVRDHRGKFLGQALYSPRSEIRLRLLERTRAIVDQAWWDARIEAALARRSGIPATAYRVVHAEGDGIPSLVVDRYDRWLSVQLLSAGLETMRGMVIGSLRRVMSPAGILLRHDAPVRRHEGLPLGIELADGTVPQDIEVEEGGIHYFAAPWTGQKTGAFLDQRANRVRAGALATPGGQALDCFAYHGSFALHLARRSDRVMALDTSVEALQRGARNAALNGFTNIQWDEGDAFDVLRALERERVRFDTIVVDPPAFAKTRSAIPGALRGYKEINLRAMRLLTAGGTLLTASCSFHVGRAEFVEAVTAAARDSGRTLTLLEHLSAGSDHPEILTIPETAYLKGLVLRCEH